MNKNAVTALGKDTRKTFQTNIHNHQMNNINQYALFMGGLNVTRDSLEQYDPLKTGFGRLFMIRPPLFVAEGLPNKMKKFKHILEYANVGVSGMQDIEIETNQLTGGYAGRSMDIPNIAKDGANELTVKVYEFSGSPVREIIQFWMSGMADFNSGFTTYHGVNVPVCQANQTAEFIYVSTDQTGKRIEYACQWSNCFPRNLKLDQFNYDAGQHDVVSYDIQFFGTRYMSPQINNKATQLITKYNLLMDSLNFNGGYTTDEVYATHGTVYSGNDGKIHSKDSALEDRTIFEHEYDGD